MINKHNIETVTLVTRWEWDKVDDWHHVRRKVVSTLWTRNLQYRKFLVKAWFWKYLDVVYIWFFTTWNTFPNGRNIKCYALALLSGSQRLRICRTLLISSPSFDARLQSLCATWPLKPSSGNEAFLDERSMSELRKLYPFSNPTERLSGAITASTPWIIFPRPEPAFRSASARKFVHSLRLLSCSTHFLEGFWCEKSCKSQTQTSETKGNDCNWRRDVIWANQHFNIVAQAGLV